MVGNPVDDFDQSEQHEDLCSQRYEREQRMVMMLLVQEGLLFADGFGVAKVFHLDAVELGHDLNHDDAVPLTP